MENHIKAATHIANLLDNQFNFFGIRFGLNGVLGLIPGVGDFIVAALSFYIVWIAVRLGLPLSAISQMVSNIIANFLIGLLPVIGDAVDFFNHANLRNLKILKKYAERGVIEGKVVDPTKHISYR